MAASTASHRAPIYVIIERREFGSPPARLLHLVEGERADLEYLGGGSRSLEDSVGTHVSLEASFKVRDNWTCRIACAFHSHRWLTGRSSSGGPRDCGVPAQWLCGPRMVPLAY